MIFHSYVRLPEGVERDWTQNADCSNHRGPEKIGIDYGYGYMIYIYMYVNPTAVMRGNRVVHIPTKKTILG